MPSSPELISSPAQRWWRHAFAAGLVAGTVLLFAGGTEPLRHRLSRELWDYGHILLFSGFALLLAMRLRAPRITLKLLALVAAAAPLGLLVEFVQLYTGRDFSLRDVLFDTIGALLGALLGARRALLREPRALAFGLLATGVGCFSAIAVPLLATAWDTWEARRQFPLLAGFASTLELERFNPRTDNRIVDGQLEVTFAPGARFPGFYLDDFPNDWSAYRTLIVDTVNPQTTPLTLICRIHDRRHNYQHNDRFNARFTLPPGFSRIRIDLDAAATAPRARRMELRDIAGFGCFRPRSALAERLYVKQIRLE